MRRSCVVVGLLAVLAAAGCAQVTEDAEGSKDHSLLSRYPGSFIAEYQTVAFDEFTLPLGKTNDDGKLEKSLRVEGKITRLVYDIPSGRSVVEVYRNYEAALTRGGFQVLFSCANSDGCGESGPTLYAAHGSEDWAWGAGDRILSAKLTRPQGDVFVYLLVGQWSDMSRGPSAYLYVVEAKPMQGNLVTVNAAALAGDISRTGHSAVYGIYFDTGKAEVKPESDAALKEISKLLQQEPGLKLLVVGHTDNVGTLGSNMDLSLRRAAAVVHVLAGKYGVAASRLVPQGVGPLAPVASNRTEEGRARNRRVELVEQ